MTTVVINSIASPLKQYVRQLGSIDIRPWRADWTDVPGFPAEVRLRASNRAVTIVRSAGRT
ncbi:hypothetical protein MES5069_240038 [Mesorhizobium escarrei]|uniref:ASCH domain-containing protein n=1 Tax=Mesorhizobium escarrei TaxID=666018 RepID=A0ABM9DTQ3_9HYPH|nr:hypothetical protein MES5069_240038 [Mesorhizobium escarrei]